MLCWDGKCEEGILLCCKECEKYSTCDDACREDCGGENMRWVYIGDNTTTGMDTYRCSECCCMVHVEKDGGLPRECPNCGNKTFDDELTTKVEWILTKDLLPPKSGEYLCYIQHIKHMCYLKYSAVHRAFNCDDGDRAPVNKLEVDAWVPKIEPPVFEEE